MIPRPTQSAADLRGALLSHFHETVVGVSDHTLREGAVAWRMRCFDHGHRLAALLESRSRSVAGSDVLDLACGWGGHAAAFAERGATVTGSDLGDSAFPALQQVAFASALPLSLCQASCEALPYSDDRFDIVLALELVEHIFEVERFAAELQRVLRPGGICILSTPSRLRAVFEGEPHYGLKWLAILPFRLQSVVASRVFHKSYPFPITRQYGTARSLICPFVRAGLRAEATVTGRLGKLLRNRPGLQRVVANLAWNVVLLEKPPGAGSPVVDSPADRGSET